MECKETLYFQVMWAQSTRNPILHHLTLQNAIVVEPLCVMIGQLLKLGAQEEETIDSFFSQESSVLTSSKVFQTLLGRIYCKFLYYNHQTLGNHSECFFLRLFPSACFQSVRGI